jgi:RimJ/RimL family protein N-acetyltransferase
MALTIETERIDLRPWNIEKDLPIMAKINADEETMRYFPRTYTEEETKNLMVRANESIEQNGFGLFAAELRDEEILLGFVGLNIPSFEAEFCPCIEIGWRLDKKYWKKGYASEAAKAILDYGHRHKKIAEIVSFTSPLNEASVKVMQKIGMKADPSRDFSHPNIEKDNRLSKHVFYSSKIGG